ncbi:MAG: tripartite tricarboxylate transporter substrate binding protein [Casimicrobiaceae bacterium]
MRALKFILLILATAASQSFAQAPAFPDRPLRLVVPFTAGGNVDIVARIIAQGLTEQLKQNVIVENRPGANAIIGAEAVAHAAPDGYTLLLGTAETHAINPHIYKKLSYDPMKDLQTVGIVDEFPFALVVSPKLPVTTLAEFIAYAKQRPGKLNFASWGIGSTSQIAFAQLEQLAGIDLVHVPFKGAAPAITAVAAGTVEAFIVPLSVAVPHAKSGQVRLLAVTSAKREPSAPDTPTATEQGVPLVISGWHVIAVPKATPAGVVQRLNRELNVVNARADIREKLLKVGSLPVTSTVQQAQAMVESEWQRWGTVVSKAAITAD